MKAKCLLFGAFAVWLTAAGCGGNSVVKVPPAVSCTPSSQPEFAVDPSSKFVYVTNRLDNTVSMFTVDPGTGNLTPNTPATIAAGAQPWPIVVEPSGKFVYVGNENSPEVSIYALNSDGTLASAGSAAATAGASSVAVTATKR